MRIVDIHVHVTEWKSLGEGPTALMRRGRRDVADIERFWADAGAFVHHMDLHGIARVGLVNYSARAVMGFGREVSAFGARYRDQYPERFIAFGGLDPLEVADAAAEMAWLLDELKVDGIKVHPPHQRLAANAYGDGVAAQAVMYEACQARGVPVMVHTGTSVFPGARSKLGDPMACDDVAVDFPELRLILAHGGRPLWTETAFFLVRRHPHVYMDVSGIPPQRLLDYFPRIEDIAEKCLFGTDWPSPGVSSIRANADALCELPISDHAKTRILAGTADTLFPPRSHAGPIRQTRGEAQPADGEAGGE